MIATIHLPLWSVPATVVVLCFAPDCARWLRKRRAGEARRLRALNQLWTDEVTEGEDKNAWSARVRTAYKSPRDRATSSSATSPRPAATDAGGLGDAAA